MSCVQDNAGVLKSSYSPVEPDELLAQKPKIGRPRSNTPITPEVRKQRNREAQKAFKNRQYRQSVQLENNIKRKDQMLAELQEEVTGLRMYKYRSSLLERILQEKGIDVETEIERVQPEQSTSSTGLRPVEAPLKSASPPQLVYPTHTKQLQEEYLQDACANIINDQEGATINDQDSGDRLAGPPLYLDQPTFSRVTALYLYDSGMPSYTPMNQMLEIRGIYYPN